MKIGLHDADKEHLRKKTFPNYALMKLSAYHKSIGDTVNWWNPLEQFDKVYSSKIFDFTPENQYLPPDTVKGGTGYNITGLLPKSIDLMYPDYSIYPDYSCAIGFLTRGCPNHCDWCVVPQKEGDIKPYRKWTELIRPNSNQLVLMDNNILSSPFGLEQLEELATSQIKIDLNQGMDARLVTEEIACLLSRIKWIKYIRFSCDQISQLDSIFNACKWLKKHGVSLYKIFIYVLVRKDLQGADFRVQELKKIKGLSLYAQAERNSRKGIIPNKAQLEFAQRYVYGRSYRKETWQTYCIRNHLPYRFY